MLCVALRKVYKVTYSNVKSFAICCTHGLYFISYSSCFMSLGELGDYVARYIPRYVIQ